MRDYIIQEVKLTKTEETEDIEKYTLGIKMYKPVQYIEVDFNVKNPI